MIPVLSLLVAALLSSSVASAASGQYEEEVSFRTLAPGDRGGHTGGLHVADALLSDWEGDHWVSLDADLDKVALSWKTTEKEITFQVRHSEEWKTFQNSRKKEFLLFSIPSKCTTTNVIRICTH